MARLTRLADVAMLALRRRDPDGLPAIGRSVCCDRDRIVAIGPDEWLVIGGDDDAAALGRRHAPLGGIQVDVSGNRVVYRVDGPAAVNLLASGCALDLAALTPDDAVSTVLARAQVILVCASQDVLLVLPRRSFVEYFEAWVREAFDGLATTYGANLAVAASASATRPYNPDVNRKIELNR